MQQGYAKLVPIYNIYASSMMASRSPIVAEQLPVAAWHIGRDDAKEWAIASGDYLALEIDKQQIILPVKIVHYLAEGCIGYPVGQVAIVHPSMPASVHKVDAPVMMTGEMANAAHLTADMPSAPTTTQEV